MTSKSISGLGSKSLRSVFVPIRASHAENHRRLDGLMIIPSTSAETEYSFVFDPALFINSDYFLSVGTVARAFGLQGYGFPYPKSFPFLLKEYRKTG